MPSRKLVKCRNAMIVFAVLFAICGFYYYQTSKVTGILSLITYESNTKARIIAISCVIGFIFNLVGYIKEKIYIKSKRG